MLCTTGAWVLCKILRKRQARLRARRAEGEADLFGTLYVPFGDCRIAEPDQRVIARSNHTASAPTEGPARVTGRSNHLLDSATSRSVIGSLIQNVVHA